MLPVMSADFRIVDLASLGADRIDETAERLREAFAERTDSYRELAAARREVIESLEPSRLSRVALDGAQRVAGWIGGRPMYDGRVWELHPLFVAAPHRGLGLGRALVRELEALVRERGALTLLLGTDDERDETSLSGVDLYDDLPARIRDVRNHKGHPYSFYERLGFRIVGVIPDADGRGRPDILMAKRVG